MIQKYFKKQNKQEQTKYPCEVCLQRVKTPITCRRCKHCICISHLNKINNKCPFCRLQPFQYQVQQFINQLSKLERKRQQDNLILTKVFKCLVQDCNFQGKFHQMDIHRRKIHKNQKLRQIIFEDDRLNGLKRRALQKMLKNFEQKKIIQNRVQIISQILYKRCNKVIQIQKLRQMQMHIERCKDNGCKKVHLQAIICFIGTQDKQMTSCVQAQKFTTYI